MKYALISFLLLSSFMGDFTSTASETYFNDSHPEIIKLGNNLSYEIGIRKTNGGIAYIIDKNTGALVSLGSRYECLWGAVFSGDDYVGGCDYSRQGSNRFSYSWSPATSTLILTYTPPSTSIQGVTAQVGLTVSENAWFDLQLELENQWGSRLDYVLFPSDLVFIESEIQEALLPINPGIILEPTFFEQNRTYTATYPGYPGVFADYVSLKMSNGRLAIYAIQNQNMIQPDILGFIHDDEYHPDSTYYYHAYGAGIPHGNSWESPTIRFRVGSSHVESIRAYRKDNRLEAFLSLGEKLGSGYDNLVQAPLLKADAAQLGRPFSDYGVLLDQLPSPSLFHPCAYMPGGHDENYPDFLPPDALWGTTAQMNNMFKQAQQRDLLVMPYTNPTWWDDESPTLENLPPSLTIQDVAVINATGDPVYEYYWGRGGYVISPYPTFVKNRLDQLMVSMTESLPSDYIFEDQIGIRPWLFDFNASSPGPMAYMDGWIDHSRIYRNHRLMTENGYDLLAETEIGFHGSLLLFERDNLTTDWWGENTWHYYPLSTIMARDKALFYQHDLAEQTMTQDRKTLTWNLAMGFMLSYDLVETEYGGGLGSEWLNLVGVFQKQVLSQYAGNLINDYIQIQPDSTRTNFGYCQVIANWSSANPFSWQGSQIPPEGVLVDCGNGGLVAGVLTRFNQMSLTPGDHYLVIDRDYTKITVWQPLGGDTALTLPFPPGWLMSDPLLVRAFDERAQKIADVPFIVNTDGITFTWIRQVGGKGAAYYTIENPSYKPDFNYLPVILSTGS